VYLCRSYVGLKGTVCTSPILSNPGVFNVLFDAVNNFWASDLKNMQGNRDSLG
jgi:hypothetical protein